MSVGCILRLGSKLVTVSPPFGQEPGSRLICMGGLTGKSAYFHDTRLHKVCSAGDVAFNLENVFGGSRRHFVSRFITL